MKYIIIIIVATITFFGCSSNTIIVTSPNLKIRYFKSENDQLVSIDSLSKINMDTSQLKPPIVVKKYKPSNYPAKSQTGTQDNVNLTVRVNSDGFVKNAEISSSQTRWFDKVAIDLIMEWEFSPFIENGQRKEFVATIPLDFVVTNRFVDIIFPE